SERGGSSGMLSDLALGATADAQGTVGPKGIASGTVLATLDGYLPVDFLEPGNRVVTREGMQILRAVRVHRYSGPAVTITASALGHDRPEQDLTLPSETKVLLRDWRAGALYGSDQAMVPVSRLIDEEYISATRVTNMRLYELSFDAPQVIYAEGVELCCDAMESPIAAE
ncbi:MAG: Hint domain-containing protein, partial [Rhodobacteraceae bacterium]|nr:Hint domain-containing protein [Paracoccaceae bacterium]